MDLKFYPSPQCHTTTFEYPSALQIFSDRGGTMGVSMLRWRGLHYGVDQNDPLGNVIANINLRLWKQVNIH